MANLKDTIVLGDLSVTGAISSYSFNIKDLYVGSISPLSGTSISVGGALVPAKTGMNIGTSGKRWNFGYFSGLNSSGRIVGVGDTHNSGLMRKYTGVSVKNLTAISARSVASGIKCYVTGLNTGDHNVYFCTSNAYSGMFCVAIDDWDTYYGNGESATCYFYGACFNAHSANATTSSLTLYALPN